MTIQRLSRLSDWQLKDSDQDLNGKSLRSQNGEVIGTVIDMVVDTEAGLVTSVVMQDDTHVATEDIELHDGQIWLSELAKRPAYAARESSRFVPGEQQVNKDIIDEDAVDEPLNGAPRAPGPVRPLRDSKAVREEIRRALEEHKKAQDQGAPRDLQQDIKKPDSSGQADSDRP